MIGKERVASLLCKSGKSWKKTTNGWKTEEPPVLHVSFDETFGWRIWVEGEQLWLPQEIQLLYDRIEEALVLINETVHLLDFEPDFETKWRTIRGFIRQIRTFRSTKAIRRKDEHLYEISFLSCPQGTSKLLIGYSHTFSYWVLDPLFYERPFYTNEEYEIGEWLSRLHYFINQWNQKNV